MHIDAYLKRSLAHAHWADAQILEALLLPGVPEKALRLAAHYFSTYSIWGLRILGEPVLQRVWPDLAGFDFAGTLLAGHESVRAVLEKYGPDYEAEIAYTSSQGQPFTNSVADILQHLFLHGQYHRGQINQLLREAGVEPVSIDFVSFARV